MIKSSTREGKILSVSIQGNSYFAVIRYEGKVLLDMMGNPVACGRSIAGVPSYTPELTITMTEALIPLNINSSIQCTDPKLLVGSKCIVYMENEKSEFPISAMIISDSDSRSISRKSMWEIRNMNPDAVIDNRSKKYVKEQGTVQYDTLEQLISEVFDPEFHGGAVGFYNDNQDMFRVSTKDMSEYVDFSTKTQEENVTGVAGFRTLRSKLCYMPATVFTGRT